MKSLSQLEIKALTENVTGPCVSIYMPTHRSKAENQQDPIRFKNLLGQAERRLLASGLRGAEANDLLAPARKLPSEEPRFWQYQSDGLALFLSAQVFRHYRVPLVLDELVVVAPRFHIAPLLPLLGNEERYYLLALSQDGIRLLESTRYSSREVDLEGVPGSLAEALRYDDPQKQLQYHTGTPQGGPGKRAAIFFGHGADSDEAKDRILRYFRQIDEGLRHSFGDEGAPLVLAGVEYLLPIYRQANTYRYLVDAGITGSPEELSAEHLREQAWPIVEPLFLRQQSESIAEYQRLAGTGRTSNALQEVVAAAYHGRVGSLLVAVGTQRWGSFSAETDAVQVSQELRPGDEDLLNLATIHTLANGGAVYALRPEQVPDNAPLAAVLRY